MGHIYHLCRSAIERKKKAQSFLSKYPGKLCDGTSCQDLWMAASTMTVVNDSAERDIAFMQQYNMPLTKNEEQ